MFRSSMRCEYREANAATSRTNHSVAAMATARNARSAGVVEAPRLQANPRSTMNALAGIRPTEYWSSAKWRATQRATGSNM